MPQLQLLCDDCGEGWDGVVLTEYPSLRFCTKCLTRITRSAIQLLGQELFDELIRLDTFHILHLLSWEHGFYRIPIGCSYIGRGYAHDFDAQARRTPDASFAVRLRAIGLTRDAGSNRPEGQGLEADQLNSLAALEAEARNDS